MSRSPASRALHAIFSRINKRRQWHEVPHPFQGLNLLSQRLDLRDMNLFGTCEDGHGETPPPEALRARTPGGRWNDLEHPDMGAAGTEFTRNVNPERIRPEKPPRLYDPNPRTVSLELMTRDPFQPATNLNSLAAAWIQFENHNWFFHGRGEAEQTMDVPVADDDPWPDHPMHVRRTVPAEAGRGGPAASGRGPVDYGNTETHWWDASQLYGSSVEKQ